MFSSVSAELFDVETFGKERALLTEVTKAWRVSAPPRTPLFSSMSLSSLFGGEGRKDRSRACHTCSREWQVCNLAVSNGGPGSSEDEYLSAGAQSTTTTNAPWCRG